MREILGNCIYAPWFLKWVNDRIGTDFKPENAKYMAYVDGNDVLAVIVFSNWKKHHVEMSIASDNSKRWATRKFIREVYEYAFQLNSITRINFVAAVENEDAIRMHHKLGHVLEGRLVDWFGAGQDALLFRRTREEYKKSKWSKE